MLLCEDLFDNMASEAEHDHRHPRSNMNIQTEFLPLDEAADKLKVSVNSLLLQATEGLLQIYWLLNKTLYSDTLELQPVGSSLLTMDRT